MAGYDFGVGVGVSSSAAASLSGATDLSGGGNFGGTSYGPGSLVRFDQSGSLGAAIGSSSWVNYLVIAGLAIAGVWIFRKAGR